MRSFFFYLILQILLPAGANAQGSTSGAFPASALPLSSRRDVIQSPVQMRHLGFPVSDPAFSDPIIAEPTPAKNESMTQPKATRNPSTDSQTSTSK